MRPREFYWDPGIETDVMFSNSQLQNLRDMKLQSKNKTPL